MEPDERLKLKKTIEELKKYRTRHTELISVYVPAGFNINLITTQITQELSTSQNIKSKQTKTNVTTALERALQELKGTRQAPPNGFALFSGNISEEEGRDNFQVWIVVPPEKINVKIYRCDQQFLTEPLEKMLEAKYVFGLIVIERQEATIGVLKGKTIDVLKTIDSLIPGKQRQGGQSAMRFQRVRANLEKSFYNEVGELARNKFKDYEIRGILVGGPGPTKESFLDAHSLGEFEKKVIGVKDIGSDGEAGLNELVNRSSDVLAKEEVVEEKEMINKFFDEIAKNSGLAVYGKEYVMNALEIGAVDTLIISERLDGKILDEFIEKAKNTSTKFIIASTETKEGNQLFELGGFAAILRYKIE